MPRAKDAKVWNADLVLAFEARAQQSLAQGKNTHITWRKAAETIEAVRKDIYQAKTGRIYSLPENKLGKNALTLARAIIEKRKEILPSGHIPENEQQAARMDDTDYWDSYPYLKKIKKRGGAYAILMAFRHSATKTLSKDQICRLAQQHCDEEMEANFHAGRMHGAWSSNTTLCKHNMLTKEGGNRNYVPEVGFRTNGPSRLTLTRDGEKFTEAMIRKFPNDYTAQEQHGVTPATPQQNAPSLFNAFGSAYLNRVTPTGACKMSTLMKKDESEMREWLSHARAGQQKTFEVGKDRRQCIHNLCDALELEMPGLRLRHDSAGASRARSLFVTVVRTFQNAREPKHERITPVSPAKRPLLALESSFIGTGHLLSSSSPGKKIRTITATAAAANAALERAAFHESKKEVTARPAAAARRKLFAEKEAAIYIASSDDSDDDIPGPSGLTRSNPVELDVISDDCQKPAANENEEPVVLDLCDSQRIACLLDLRDFSVAIRNNSTQEVISLDSDDDDELAVSKRVVNPYAKVNQKAKANPTSLTIYIDDRERNRNATPRRLRTELMRLLETGALQSIWPQGMDSPTVEEVQLRFGDFSFCLGEHRLDIAVERKQIRDLVQRSTRGDHWKQLGKMRDSFRHAVLLIEVDPRHAARFEAHGSQNLDTWNPFNTVIDDERSFYFFLGRALLSHRSVKFIQTREFQGSLRAVGALGLIAASLKLTMDEDAEQHVRHIDQQTRLMKRLTCAGVPQLLADQVAKEYGSSNHLDEAYQMCVDEICRSMLLESLVKHTNQGELEQGSASAWSESIFRAFYSIHSNTSIAAKSFQGLKGLVEDHGELLCCLHQEKDAKAALDAALSRQYKGKKGIIRSVQIELCKEQMNIFPPQTEESFYSLNASSSQPFGASVPTLILTTRACNFVSSKTVVQIVSGTFVVHEVKAVMNRLGAEYVRTAHVASASIMKAAQIAGLSTRDRRVLIIRGLPPAVEAEGKKAGYRSELKTLIDLVAADLMLRHDVVVIEAFRQTGDVELILQQLALACFHYQLLTDRIAAS